MDVKVHEWLSDCREEEKEKVEEKCSTWFGVKVYVYEEKSLTTIFLLYNFLVLQGNQCMVYILENLG